LNCCGIFGNVKRYIETNGCDTDRGAAPGLAGSNFAYLKGDLCNNSLFQPVAFPVWKAGWKRIIK
jgi:hypothetical protein